MLAILYCTQSFCLETPAFKAALIASGVLDPNGCVPTTRIATEQQTRSRSAGSMPPGTSVARPRDILLALKTGPLANLVGQMDAAINCLAEGAE